MTTAFSRRGAAAVTRRQMKLAVLVTRLYAVNLPKMPSAAHEVISVIRPLVPDSKCAA